MQLSIYQKEVFNQYKSNSQIARVLTEKWFSDEMYCPCCLAPKIEEYPNNKKVSDFLCNNCCNEFQLKAASKKFSTRVTDGEYHTMTGFIKSDKTPNFFLMHYSNDEWAIRNLFLIPKFFISISAIEKRNPLSENARRAGWTGCNILLTRISEDGKIPIVKDEKIIDKETVNKKWQKMSFLNQKNPYLRGWTADVLKCIRDIKKDEFSLKEVYKFTEYLKELHPNNNNVEAKIRQQLQILRDNNILKFKEKGQYSLIN